VDSHLDAILRRAVVAAYADSGTAFDENRLDARLISDRFAEIQITPLDGMRQRS
jgi:hypothetical protein